MNDAHLRLAAIQQNQHWHERMCEIAQRTLRAVLDGDVERAKEEVAKIDEPRERRQVITACAQVMALLSGPR